MSAGLEVSAAPTGRTGGRWRNWSRLEDVRPARILTPGSIAEVQQAVRDARRDGLTVKAVGAGHSFTGIAAAPGVLLDLAGLDGLLAVDAERMRATFAAGTNLYQVPALLAPHGLAMANLGDIDRQTLAGATSTGTHGTGAAYGGVATQIVAVALVTGDGELLRVSETENAELLPAVRLGLGALGILVEITLQLVPAFLLRAVEAPVPLAEIEQDLVGWLSSADHAEFHWFPGTETASTKRNHRLPAGAERDARAGLSRWFDEELLGNGVFAVLNALQRVVPPLVKPVNRIAAQVFANGEFTEDSAGVFSAPRRVRFREMEYALPRENLAEAFAELRDLHRRNDWWIELPVEVRLAAADENWLSTAHDRDTGYLAVHRHWRRPHEPYFRACEEVFLRYGGRPHWGKLHFRDRDFFADAYPRFADFLAVRDRLDPDRIFTNPYLARVLGP